MELIFQNELNQRRYNSLKNNNDYDISNQIIQCEKNIERVIESFLQKGYPKENIILQNNISNIYGYKQGPYINNSQIINRHCNVITDIIVSPFGFSKHLVFSIIIDAKYTQLNESHDFKTNNEIAALNSWLDSLNS